MNEADRRELEQYRAMAALLSKKNAGALARMSAIAEKKRKADAMKQRPDEPDHQYKARIGLAARRAMSKIRCGQCKAELQMCRDFTTPKHNLPNCRGTCPRSGEDLFELALDWQRMLAPGNEIKQ